jgi:hypothetical protein
MRLSIAVFLIPVLTFKILAAHEEPKQDGNVQCVQRLRLPVYPAIAVQARISGDVPVNISLGKTSTVEHIAFMGKSHPLLAKSVLDAVKASTFTSVCQDLDVTLLFRFVIEGKGTDYPTTPVISFGFPNTFWIATPPRNVQP